MQIVSPAVILIAHGSPDPDWRAPIERLERVLRGQLEGRHVEACYMEHAEPSLGDVLDGLLRTPVRDAVVVPVFLSPGGRHIKKDLPALVQREASSRPPLSVRLMPGALGADDVVVHALATATLERLSAPNGS